MKNLLIRAISGAVYVALLVGCTLFNPISSFFFFGLVTVATMLEFGTLMNRHAGASLLRPVNALAGFVLVGTVWLYCMGGATASKTAALYGLTLLFLLIRELYSRAENPLRNWALCFASQLYIAVPFSLLPLISLAQNAQGEMTYTWIYVLALFVFIWTNDTGAYLFGFFLHNHIPYKLFPRISPNKTWVGSIGGGLLTVAVSVLVWHLCQGSLSLLQWIGYALVVVFFGTWGDLVESMLKRQLGIKDSGHVLPGHGGMLDRFDSCLLAIPAIVAYIYLVAG